MAKASLIFQIINVCLGIFLAFIGVWRIVTLKIFTSLGANFFQVFMPFFLILFGAMIIIAELKKDFGNEYCKFIRTFMGRGIFYLFLASLSVYQVKDESSDTLGYVYGLILLIFGIIYMIFHCFSPSGTLGEIKESLI